MAVTCDESFADRSNALCYNPPRFSMSFLGLLTEPSSAGGPPHLPLWRCLRCISADFPKCPLLSQSILLFALPRHPGGVSLHPVLLHPLLSSLWPPTFKMKNAGRWHMLATQRSLHPVLSCCLCTARGTHFCLLCCQPRPIRRLSRARTAQLTPRSPCAPRAC